LGTGLTTFEGGIAVTTGGIQFPATQSASADANNLDDYEEGTVSGITATMSISGTVTVTAAASYFYTKVGNVCHYQFEINTTAVSSPVGHIQIPLPFASATGQAYTAGALRVYGETFTGSPYVGVHSNAAVAVFETSRSGTGTGDITPTAGSRYYFGEVTYRVA
jgi:hypothetical protein